MVNLTDEDLFYSPENDAENLYFLLYTMYIDDSMSHFAWRRDAEVCSWNREECLEECINILGYGEDDVRAKLDTTMSEFEFPESVKKAIADMEEIISQREAEKDEMEDR